MNPSGESQRFKRAWKLLTPALLGLVAVETYFLLHDTPLFRGPPPAPFHGVPVAELMRIENGVRVKALGDIVWEEARSQQTLVQRQSLLTLDKSAAEVAFLDGTGLALGENTLIEIEKRPNDLSGTYDRLVVRLLRGSAQKKAPRGRSQILQRLAAQTPSLEIQIGNSRSIVTAETEFKAAIRGDEARIQVVSGELTLQSDNGDLRVSAREEASIGATTSQTPPSVRKTAFNLTYPRGDERVGGERIIRFRWSNDTNAVGGMPLELEVSKDPSFQEAVTRQRIAFADPPLAQVEAALELPKLSTAAADRWYWRVRAMDRNAEHLGVVSETETFWRKPPPLPVLSYPADNAAFSANESVDLVWSALTDATSYEIEWKQGDAVQTKTARQTHLTLPADPSGKIRWRVRARLSDGTSTDWSEPRLIQVAAAKAAPLPPMEPAATAAKANSEDLPPPPSNLHDAEIEEKPLPAPTPEHSGLRRVLDWLFAQVWITPVYGAENPSYPVHLAWDPVEGVHQYHVQVAKTRSFATILGEADVESPEWNWKFQSGMANSKGRVFYRVASKSASGKIGSYSSPKSVKIPRSILAKANASPAPKVETYNAMEEGGPARVVPGGGESDSAIDPDEMLSPQVVVKASPKLSPAAAPQTRHETPLKSEAAAEKSIAMSPSPPFEPASKPAPTPTPVAIPEGTAVAALPAIEVHRHDRWLTTAWLPFGYGSQHQDETGSALSSVSLDKPYFQNRLRAGLDMLRTEDEEVTHHWSMDVGLGIAKFEASDEGKPLLQDAQTGFDFRAEAIRWAKAAEGRGQLGFGLELKRVYRWVKTGPQSVTTDGSLSLGPVFTIMRKSLGETPVELGLQVGVPVTGALTSGFYGLEGVAWAEWTLTRAPSRTAFGVRVELEGTWNHWSSTSSSTLTQWSAWVSPFVRFGAHSDCQVPAPSL